LVGLVGSIRGGYWYLVFADGGLGLGSASGYESVVSKDGCHPAAELVAVAATSSEVRPQRFALGEGGGLARV
jgi:hypothetical protein